MKEKAFQDYYANIINRLQVFIEKFWEQKSYENIMVNEALAKLKELHAHGKRLRGMLVYIGYQMVYDDDIQAADALAAAFEMFQTAILIHDDVIDHADSRRNQKTIHVQYYEKFSGNGDFRDRQFEAVVKDMGNSLAICVGDIGLYMAEQILVDAYQRHERFGEILSYYHEMLIKTIQGEIIDVQLPCIERYGLWENEGLSNDELKTVITDIYHLKTSCYTIIGPLCSGMLLGGANGEQIEKMQAVGDKIGIAFQLQDDILGIFGNEQETGKDVGSDISEFKQTFLYAYVREMGGCAYQELKQYYGKERLEISEVERVRQIFEKSGALAYTKQMINTLLQEAETMLADIDGISEMGKDLLRAFIFCLIKRKN